MGLLTRFPCEEELTHDHDDIAPTFDMLLAKFFREVVSFLIECVDDRSIVSPRAIGWVERENLAVRQ